MYRKNYPIKKIFSVIEDFACKYYNTKLNICMIKYLIFKFFSTDNIDIELISKFSKIIFIFFYPQSELSMISDLCNLWETIFVYFIFWINHFFIGFKLFKKIWIIIIAKEIQLKINFFELILCYDKISKIYNFFSFKKSK